MTERASAHPLDGARLKVARAEEHLDTLNAEIARYIETRPHGLFVKDTGSGWNLSVNVTEEPPLRLSVLIGDVIGNLRPALDYIAWELATRYSGRQLVPGQDKIYFPIFVDPPKFRRKPWEKYTIPGAALDDVESVQPYHAGYKPLWWLHELANADKHRLPALTVGHVDSASIVKQTGGVRTEIARGEPMGPGPHFGTSDLAFAAPPGGDVRVFADATVFVAIDDAAMPRDPAQMTLFEILKCVTDIVRRFDRFF